MQLKLNLQVILLAIFLVNNVRSDAIQLTGVNFDHVVGSSELVFVNFYAGWCRFSNMLEPIWNEFADKISKEYNSQHVVVAKVDADNEKVIAAQNGINKYPTLKIYRYGVLVKKEYRGARTVEAFQNYIKEQLVSKLIIVNSAAELQLLKDEKPTILGYFENQESENYKTYLKLANILRDRVEFVAAIGPNFIQERGTGDVVIYKENGGNSVFDWTTNESKLRYTGEISRYPELYAWAYERCTPTVRKITFENAEELTENGLPFLIIFHKTDDTASIKTFENEVKRQLPHLLNTVMPVSADGNMFSHPLNHLGKSINDLPVIAIDSFKHMYLFPDNKKYTEGENLAQFVLDLNSGKLHREFHNGPDPVGIEMVPNVQFQIVVSPEGHLPKIPEQKPVQHRTDPPESAFAKLAPSQNRYSVRHGDGGEF